MTPQAQEKKEVTAIGLGKRGGYANRFANDVKPTHAKKTLGRLLHYFAPERKGFVLLTLLVIVHTLSSLVAPLILGRWIDAIDHALSKGITQVPFVIGGWLLGTYLLAAVFQWLQGRKVAGISQGIIKRLRQALFDKLTHLPIAYFDGHSHGDIMSRMTNDVDQVSTTLAESLAQLIVAGLTVTGALIMMVYLSPLLTLASLMTLPLIFLLSRTIAKHARPLFKQQAKHLGTLNGLVEETISGLNVVQAFNQQDNVLKTFRQENNLLKTSGMKAQIWAGYLMPMMNVINNLGFTIIGFVGGYMALKGLVSIGVIASFITYSRHFGRPLNEIASVYNTLQSALASAERLFELLDETNEINTGKTLLDTENHATTVTFNKVNFSYDGQKNVLRDISFHVTPGKKVALVGPTGAGKTTIANLIARFYDPHQGQILMDDVPLCDYSRVSLYDAFGIVLQDAYLFSGSIYDNIRYGRLDASDEEVHEAARLAMADDFIQKLPHQYHTCLTDGGKNISQGERQLITIARAVIAKPKILILDEATSNVDTRTEKKIQQALLHLMQGRTSFIIAHRLSTIKDADHIMVIDHGKIMEAGTHDDLMAQRGHYHHMMVNQYNKVDVIV